jgi:AcrR family transcriptional regulator
MTPPIKTFKNLKAAEKETRKQLIIDAAERVFAHKPHDHVSMKEIAAEAGIATASIYNYFQNQEDLFIESFMRDAGALIADLKVLSADGARPRYQEIIEIFIDYFTNKDSYFRMMANFMLYGKISDHSLEKFNAIFREMLDNFEKAFIGNKESSETRYYSHIMFAFLNGLLINFRKYPGRSEEEVVGHMKKLGDIFSRLLEQIPTK